MKKLVSLLLCIIVLSVSLNVIADVTVSDEKWDEINKALEIAEHAQVDRDSCEGINKLLNKDNEKLKKKNNSVMIVTGVTFTIGFALGTWVTIKIYDIAKKR